MVGMGWGLAFRSQNSSAVAPVNELFEAIFHISTFQRSKSERKTKVSGKPKNERPQQETF